MFLNKDKAPYEIYVNMRKAGLGAEYGLDYCMPDEPVDYVTRLLVSNFVVPHDGYNEVVQSQNVGSVTYGLTPQGALPYRIEFTNVDLAHRSKRTIHGINHRLTTECAKLYRLDIRRKRIVLMAHQVVAKGIIVDVVDED